MRLIILLFCLFSSYFAQSVVNNTALGTSVTVAANTQITIHYIGGFSLTITTSKTDNITVSAFNTISVNLPTGYTALNLGFVLKSTNGAIVSASLTTGALTGNAATLINGGLTAGCLQFDANTGTYNQIDFTSYTVATGITVPLAHVGTYVFVGIQANVPTPTFFGVARALFANTRRIISYTQGIIIDVTTQDNTSVTVTFSATNLSPNTPPNFYVSLSAFFDIELSTTVALQATINYTYTATQLVNANVAATTLQLGFYDIASATWQFPGNIVDTTNMIISTTTTHFSNWGAYGTVPAPPPPTSPSSGSTIPTSAASSLLFGAALFAMQLLLTI